MRDLALSGIQYNFESRRDVSYREEQTRCRRHECTL